MLGTDLASLNIIGNVCIHSGPVDGGLGQASHLLYASMIVMKVTEHSAFSHTAQGYTHTVSPFNNTPFSMVNSSLIPQKCHAIWGTSLTLSGQPFKVNLYMKLWMESLSTVPLTLFNLPGVRRMSLCFDVIQLACFLFWMESDCGGLPIPFLFLAYIELCNYFSVGIQ